MKIIDLNTQKVLYDDDPRIYNMNISCKISGNTVTDLENINGFDFNDIIDNVKAYLSEYGFKEIKIRYE